MTEQQIAPYGSWESPITGDLIASETIRLDQIALDGDAIYWTEGRPLDGGRNVIVRRSFAGDTLDVNPSPYSARSRVHEYGGGAFAVAERIVYFSNYADQRLYRQEPGGDPRPITPEGDFRYAAGVIDHRRGRLICVREDHSQPGREAVNTLVAVALGGDDEGGRVLVSGNDFYSDPRLSPDCSTLAWLTWSHPNMPWDGCELWVAPVQAGGSLGPPQLVAGGPDESIFQPQWSPGGDLFFISDRNGWWNLYAWRSGRVEPLTRLQADFGRPQWVFGQSTYAFVSPGRLICAYREPGVTRLALLDTVTGKLEPVENPFTEIAEVRAGQGFVAFIAGSPTAYPAVVRYDLSTRQFQPLRRAASVSVDEGYLSPPELVHFPTGDGLTSYAFYYAPRNPGFIPPAGERPPLLVHSHGGPTGATTTALRLDIQYWTSRGFAVLDVDYGGSTGYGRAYRQRLQGQWGIVDVDDCINAARYLVQRGLADEDRLAIRGGSAGGYTTLCALTFHDYFKAGASYFGVSDPAALARDTHKFESRYTDSLIGPYPERQDLYEERSPLHHAQRFSCPVIFFQGLEDLVVLPAQAQAMYEAVRAKELPVAYLAFEGEQHGFRRAENIRRTFDAELYFYARIFGFELAQPVEPVFINNLQ